MQKVEWMVGIAVAALLATTGVVRDAGAATLCTKKSGAVVRRDATCKRSETEMNLSEYGATGPTGPTGPAAVDGLAGATGATGATGANATGLWAVVESDGTLVRSSGATSS